MAYSDVQEAARGLLVDVVDALEPMGIEFVVIGGWCPVLRNQREDTPHPGTKDVDVLFRGAEEPGRLKDVIGALLRRGYLPSAKHAFQLLRPLPIKGREVVFNVDVLHPGQGGVTPEMFVDHFELDFCENPQVQETVRMMSIVMPSSSLVFDGYWDRHAVRGALPCGREINVSVPLLNEPGLILSKCQSVKSVKRDRDSFDLFLTLLQANAADTLSSLRMARRQHQWLEVLLQDLSRFVADKSDVFDNRTRRFLPKRHEYAAGGRSPSKLVAAGIESTESE